MNLKQRIISHLVQNPDASTTEIAFRLDINQRTVQRYLLELIAGNIVKKEGGSKNTKYNIHSEYIITGDLDYDLDDRRLETELSIPFNMDIFKTLNNINLFNDKEVIKINSIIAKHKAKNRNIDPASKKRELERLIVEFSWKSSTIEGNTYSLLETEELLVNNHPSPNHTKSETQEILNHKKTLDWIIKNSEYFKNEIKLKQIIEIHKLLTDNLPIQDNLRYSGVGITGSLYKPLDNQHQIKEAIEKMLELINCKNPIEKSLLLTLLISYIQPFADGNKRTSRLLSNAVLFANDLPLLSYRSTPVVDYKTATILFYELNNIFKFKKIFIEQLEYYTSYYQ
ncbi:MAG: Fic family protein [Thermales bacterium]|nr:Fic family protein [Thermales bacterium]